MATKTESNQIDWDDKDQVRELHDSIVKFVQGDPFSSTPMELIRELQTLASSGACWPKLSDTRWMDVLNDLYNVRRLSIGDLNRVGPAPIVEPEPHVEQLQLLWEED